MAPSARPLITRRLFLLAAGASAVAAACSDDDSGAEGAAADERASTGGETSTTTTADPTTSTPKEPVPTLTAADFAGLGTCVLLRESTAGPFPLDEQFIRRDITEGYPGHPLRLGLRVIDVGCAPVPRAAVEIWHTDSSGDYSAFSDGGTGKDEAAGTTFLRGTQVANDDGIVEFHTIYPGWYPGRAVHIHLRVRVEDRLLLTGQLYFDDAITEQVFSEHAAYTAFGLPDTINETDRIAGDPAGDGSLIALAADGDGTLGLLNVGVSA